MLVSALLSVGVAVADPCGMVPPIWTGRGQPPVGIERQGIQQTYTFFADGVQTIAIRPGFTGTVEAFGMLIPLPSVPALRKIDDRTFTHLAAVVDPPIVRVEAERVYMADDFAYPSAAPQEESLEIEREDVRVVKEEAVGMYEVAVLEAGSAAALQRWMDRNAFRYPAGMDEAVEDYVRQGWMFVAVKARVGAMSNVAPRPGMREVDDGLPRGASFDGYVQGMAFRFAVESPVVPMRLSVFNGDDTHNRVYAVTERPVRVDQVSEAFVRRQIDGRELYAHLAEPLDVLVVGGTLRDLPDWVQQQVETQRDPRPWVGVAADLIASDRLASTTGTLSLPFEEMEKEMLNVNETLGLRGAAVDQLVYDALAERRTTSTERAIKQLYGMSFTVVDGNFPTRVLAKDNLTLTPWSMPKSRNRLDVWTLQPAGPVVWY